MTTHFIETADGRRHRVKGKHVVEYLRDRISMALTYRVIGDPIDGPFLHYAHCDSDTFWRAMAGVKV